MDSALSSSPSQTGAAPSSDAANQQKKDVSSPEGEKINLNEEVTSPSHLLIQEII